VPMPKPRTRSPKPGPPIVVHLVDGTYELFRHFYGLRRFNKGVDAPLGAVTGVLRTIVQMLEGGARHIAVATDHIVESFRNDLWPGYKTGAGLEPILWRQFHPLEDALVAMGVATFAMKELEADDGLASAAAISARDPRVEKVCIWTPDKDLAQCVVGDRVVQVDRKSGRITNEDGVRAKFGVPPALIPDFLALVGDAADGYPGIPGIGKTGAARLLERFGPLEEWPETQLAGGRRDLALLFKVLATLRADAPVVEAVDELEWRGVGPDFARWAEKCGDPRLVERCAKVAASLE